MDTAGRPSKIIQIWLITVAIMVFAMAIIGAITRLTESGLSMVEWRPLIGTLPPLSEAEWQRVFAIYQETPEFQKKNSWMGLDDFKTIFFWEWFHRFWGRLIGAAIALPLLWFWLRGQIPNGYKLKTFGVGVLVGLQGLMGWYMVQSGLVDRPSVSHFRLAAHLSLAFVIFGCLIWLILDLRGSPRVPSSFCLKRHGWTAFTMLAVTIIWGAFVAGLDGGLLYNNWPQMGPHWIPPEILSVISIISDPAGVQFFHRWIAIITAFFILTFAWRIKNSILAAAVCFQVALGIATLLSHVDISLATLHQGGALILFALMLYNLHRIRP